MNETERKIFLLQKETEHKAVGESGGVWCSVCQKTICKPRKRKYFQPSMLIKCEKCVPPSDIKSYENCSEEEIDCGDAIYIETMRFIKETAKNYIDRDEIKYEIWNAMRDGIKDFLEEYYNDIVQEVSDSISESIGDNISFEINVKPDHKFKKNTGK